VSNISMGGSIAGAAASPLETKTAGISREGSAAKTTDQKIEKSAKEFESILLGSWLQQAEKSFGSLPGGDDEDDGHAVAWYIDDRVWRHRDSENDFNPSSQS